MKKISITLCGLVVCLVILCGIFTGAEASSEDGAKPVVDNAAAGAILQAEEAAAEAEATEEAVKKAVQSASAAEKAAANDLFEKTVALIKKYEGMHQPRHWPLVGYGHLVRPGEKFSRSKTMAEKDADALLRKDLLLNCAIFREFGADSLLLGTLAYNIGCGNVKRSSVSRMLRNGNRDIEQVYLAHCRYKGKAIPSIRRRRAEELQLLFVKDNNTKSSSVSITTSPVQ